MGYIDHTGHVIVPPQFEDARSFSEGLAGVKVGGRFGFINTTGRIVIEPRFSYVDRFSDELAMTVENHQLNFIDKTGKVVIPIGQWAHGVSSLGVFFNDMVFAEGVVSRPFGAVWGYVDKTGKIIIPPKFVLASPFSEGLASVSVSISDHYVWGYVNHEGKFVIKPNFQSASQFENGLAYVEISGRHGYIDRSGKVVWESSKYNQK